MAAVPLPETNIYNEELQRWLGANVSNGVHRAEVLMAADRLEELRSADRTEIEELIASWPAPARHQFVNAWHALRGEPPEAPPPEPAPMETEPTSPKQVAASEAPTPIRRNPRPVLAMLRAPQIGHPQTLTEIRFEEWCTRITRDCRLPGTLRKIPAALAASKQGFLAFLDPASLASFGATGVAMRGRRSRGGESSLVEAAAAILCREFFRDARPDTARPGKATLCPGDSSLLPMRRGHDLRTIRASWLARLDALRTGVVIIIDVPTYWGTCDELKVLANHAVSQLDENQCQIRLRSLRMDDSGDLAALRLRLKNKQLSTRQPRVYEVVDGRRELLSEAHNLLADCLHAPMQWIREKEGTLLGVATRRDPFNAGGMLADLLPALQGVRWDPTTGLWSTVDIFSSVEVARSYIQGCDEGFKLDQLNFRRTFVVSAVHGLVVAQTACRAHGLNVLNAAAASTVPKEKADTREWVVSTVNGTKLPSIKPWRPIKNLKLLVVKAPSKMRKKDDEPNPYLRATPLDIGKPPPGPDDSDERRDAATRWLERRRSARGETLVAIAEEEALNNALTIYVLDEVAKTWIVVGCSSIPKGLHNVCACDGAILLDTLVGAEVFDLDALGWRSCPSKIPEKDEKFPYGCALTAPDGSAVLLRDGGRSSRSLVSRVRRDDVSEAAPSISRGAPLPEGMRLDRLVQDPRAEGHDAGFGVCLLPMPI
jgi:hypothetical protein